MKTRVVVIAVLAAVALMLPGTSEAATAKKRTGGLQLGGGLGFGISPLDFSIGLDADYFVNEDLSIGPRFGYILGGDWGFDEDIFLFMLDAKYGIDLNKGGGMPIRPFVSAGAGFSLIDWDVIFTGSDLDAQFTFEFGGGADIYLTDNLAVGTQANFIFPIPGSEFRYFPAFDENFVFQWNIVTARVLF